MLVRRIKRHMPAAFSRIMTVVAGNEISVRLESTVVDKILHRLPVAGMTGITAPIMNTFQSIDIGYVMALGAAIGSTPWRIHNICMVIVLVVKRIRCLVRMAVCTYKGSACPALSDCIFYGIPG